MKVSEQQLQVSLFSALDSKLSKKFNLYSIQADSVFPSKISFSLIFLSTSSSDKNVSIYSSESKFVSPALPEISAKNISIFSVQ